TETAPAVSLKVDDGIALVTIDNPGESVNTLNPKFTADFEAVLSEIESSEEIKAAVIVSAKKDNFIAGADIKVLDQVSSAAEAAELSRHGQAAMQRIEDCPKPIVAAIHGTCLGGGLELALACHGRVASNHRKTKLGLPEVQLGLLPGAGGTQRLPRLIGVQAALDLILTGKQIPARKARKLGLVDEVVAPALIERAAVELAESLADAPEVEGSAAQRVADAFRSLLSQDELQELVLEDNPLGRKILFDQARKKLLEKTHGNYPAPEKALEAVKIGANDSFEKGMEAEARFFGELLVTPESRELMGIFFATTAMKKDSGVDGKKKVEPIEVGKVGMIGAGLMGAGIAYVTSAIAKTPVRLKDRDSESVGKGLAYVHDIIKGRIKRKRLSKRDATELMALVSPATEYSGLGNAEVVIEAVFEDLDLKHSILREVEEWGAEDVIFASNTSTIPITEIAKASAHPQTVIGMHYFSPVHKMPLLEIIVTDQTAPWVTATCVELGKKQGKTVIVVRDGVGFYTSRILGPYCNEAAHLIAEGVAIEDIDAALVDFGYPVGPIKLLDEVGIDVAHKAGGVVRAAFGDRLDSPPGIEQLLGDGRLGRKAGKGFYLYDGKNKGVDQSVYQVLGVTPNAEMDAEDIAMRCTLMMVNEAAHCFGEGILRSARDGDIGAIFGLGFPPFRGGPFRFVDAVGARRVVELLDLYRDKHGGRFEAAPALRKLAENGGRFYPEDDSKAAKPGKYVPEKSGIRASA
ncbi:MAG: fatty acid oxidation complex subunit alpha FadJ, partial [Deltaproteobacteria bacterium]|nr:fatty acid oxidation complex subunit alpha FadJ [Deltaproteobacteria bacterium]